MLQIIAIAFFFATLVGLTVVLEETFRASRREILDALAGRLAAPGRAPVTPAIQSRPRSNARIA